MYLQNKYTKWYNTIISRSRNRNIKEVLEEHHIIPKSFFIRFSKDGWLEGNPNDPNNLVLLTIREHRLCHLLLTKMTEGKARAKMVYAAKIMMEHRENKFGLSKGRLYEKIKKEALESLFKNKVGKKRSQETIEKIKVKRKLQVMSPVTEETKKKISLAHKGKKKTPEHLAKVVKNLDWTGKTHSEETKQKMRKPKSEQHCLNMSKARKGEPLSEEHKRKLSEAKLNAPLYECPHCGKTAKPTPFSRYHGDKCQLFKNLKDDSVFVQPT